jgi:hypothetical protein
MRHSQTVTWSNTASYEWPQPAMNCTSKKGAVRSSSVQLRRHHHHHHHHTRDTSKSKIVIHFSVTSSEWRHNCTWDYCWVGWGVGRQICWNMTSRESKGARLRVGQTTAWSIKQTAPIAIRQRNGTLHSTRQPNDCTDIDRSNAIQHLVWLFMRL